MRGMKQLVRETKVRLPVGLLAAIDRERGDVPRERWIRRVLAERLGVSPEVAPVVAPDVPAGPEEDDR